MGYEARWSDLLAVLIATDPAPLAHVLGFTMTLLYWGPPRGRCRFGQPPRHCPYRGRGPCRGHRGQSARGARRQATGSLPDAEPGADVYALLYPERLAIDLLTPSSWRGLTWETVLTAYAHSDHHVGGHYRPGMAPPPRRSPSQGRAGHDLERPAPRRRLRDRHSSPHVVAVQPDPRPSRGRI